MDIEEFKRAFSGRLERPPSTEPAPTGRSRSGAVSGSDQHPRATMLASIRIAVDEWRRTYGGGVDVSARDAAQGELDSIARQLTEWAGLWLDGASEVERKQSQDLADAVAVGRSRIRLAVTPAGSRARPVKPSLTWTWVKTNVGKGPILDGVKKSMPAFDKAFAAVVATPSSKSLAVATKALGTVRADLESAAGLSRKPPAKKKATFDGPAMAATAEALIGLCDKHAEVLGELGSQVANFDPKTAAAAAKKVLVDAASTRLTKVDQANADALKRFDIERDSTVEQKNKVLELKKTKAKDRYDQEVEAAAGDKGKIETASKKLEQTLAMDEEKWKDDIAFAHTRHEEQTGAQTDTVALARGVAAFNWPAVKPVVKKGSTLAKVLAKPFPTYDKAKAKFLSDPSAKTIQVALDALLTIEKALGKAAAAKDEKDSRTVSSALFQGARDEAALLHKAEGELPRSRLATAMMGVEGGDAVLDSQVAGLGGAAKSADDKAFVRAALKARYGLEALEGEMTTKAMPRLYDVLGRVPSGDTTMNDSLKKVVRDRSEIVPSGYYSNTDDEGKVYLAVGRTGRSGLTKELFGIALPYLEKPPGGWEGSGLTKPKASEIFDHLTLHEVGHAVDDKLGFMDKRMENSAYGAWRDSSADEVVKLGGEELGFYDAFAPHDKATLEAYLKVVLEGKDPAKDDALLKKFGDAKPDWRSMAAHAGVKFLQAARLQSGSISEVTQWDKKAKTAVHGGRVYQEAYEDTWYSYEVAVRSRGIGGYQFRAPGEWFSEIYANYFGGRLSNTHPDYAWMEALVDSEKD